MRRPSAGSSIAPDKSVGEAASPAKVVDAPPSLSPVKDRIMENAVKSLMRKKTVHLKKDNIYSHSQELKGNWEWTQKFTTE